MLICCWLHKGLNLLLGTLLSESEILHKQSNHPVHMRDNGEWSPSAFIPFCDFGGDMMVLGIKVDNFSVPVCNSFRAKILNDQLCYEIDLNQYRTDISGRKLKQGLSFLIDKNEDRQYSWKTHTENQPNLDKGLRVTL